MSPDLAIARQYLRARRHDLAEQHLRLFLSSEPDNALGHALLVDCLIARRALDEAEAEARESIRLAPDQCLGHAALASAQSEASRWRAAERSINEAIRLDMLDPHHWATLAHALTQQGRAKRAMAAADEGLRLRPTDYACLNERALALLDLGRTDAARETIRSALVSQPESAVLHSNLAFVLLSYGETSAAREEALEALRLNPTLAVAQGNLRAAQRQGGGLLTPILIRAVNWWRHRPIWERFVFVGGLAVAGLVAPVAWIMAVSIGSYWALMATRRVFSPSTSRFHTLAPLARALSIPALLVAFALADMWPRQAPSVAGLAGFTATATLTLAAAFPEPRRAALFVLTLVLVGVGSLNQSWLPSELHAPTFAQPSFGALDLNLTDDQVVHCLLGNGPSVDVPAAQAGVDMSAERSLIIDSVPIPNPFPTNQDDPVVTQWIATLTEIARTDRNFMYGCAASLINSPA